MKTYDAMNTESNIISLYRLYSKLRVKVFEWVVDKITKVMNRPNTSEESQFHQPPHVPSCNAHQLPIHNAIRFTNNVPH